MYWKFDFFLIVWQWYYIFVLFLVFHNFFSLELPKCKQLKSLDQGKIFQAKKLRCLGMNSRFIFQFQSRKLQEMFHFHNPLLDPITIQIAACLASMNQHLTNSNKFCLWALKDFYHVFYRIFLSPSLSCLSAYFRFRPGSLGQIEEFSHMEAVAQYFPYFPHCLS